MDKITYVTLGFWFLLSVMNSACGGALSNSPASLETRAQLGKPAPNFVLSDLEGNTVELDAFRGEIVVLEFFSPSCPFVETAHGREFTLKKKAQTYAEEGVKWLALNSEPPDGKGFDLNALSAMHKKFEMSYPILLDAGGKIGELYDAKKTPEVFIIDGEGVLVYVGAVDNTMGGDLDDADPPPALNFVDHALKRLLADEPVLYKHTEAWG